ncbi:Uncharacterized protein YebE, UPF0316 family [Paenibacillus catalpae]|uniref:Uncharacterized protein YebE, UPF0316 family n=1 Tax=Paenibacillus catalpae TaxID=1045775 RepID=A0A1I2BUI2_9BACL|nr:DUF5698 domain-containing protein [Paenibacillus catalpae]SFE59806.1 Uncharacterized protein YebE, UPF0316 family [Paenibacillus catalpae]
MNWDLISIFVFEFLFVTVMTFRWIILVKGKKYTSAAICILEQSLNIVALSMVVTQFDDPLRIIVYALGYATGSIAGSMIEERLALGYTQLQIITSISTNLPQQLRELGGIGVTEWTVLGKEQERLMMMVVIRRKWAVRLLDRIQEIEPEAFIVEMAPQAYRGGYIPRQVKTRFF